jgi:GAF domain-containing protein
MSLDRTIISGNLWLVIQSSEQVDDLCARVDDMIESGAPRNEILSCLIAAAESVGAPRAVASILVLDEQGLLRNGHSPGLPDDYLAAIDRLKPDPRVGTCAAAAATAAMVVTPDFLSDDKWAELKHLPRSLGYVGAWSMPIISRSGSVLGTFGTYYRDQREPTSHEVSAIRRLAAAAARLLER